MALNIAQNILTIMGYGLLPGAKCIQASVFDTATTSVLYTCPTGKKAIVFGVRRLNATGAAQEFRLEYVDSGSTAYRLTSVISQGNNTYAATDFPCPILEASEKLQVVVSSGGGASNHFWASVIEFNSNANLKSAKLTGTLASGDNTVYTCPAGYNALVLDTKIPEDFARPLVVFNGSGSSKTIQWNVAPTGIAVGATNAVTVPRTTVANNAIDTQTMSGGIMLNSGDVVNVNMSASTATSMAFINVLELIN